MSNDLSDFSSTTIAYFIAVIMIIWRITEKIFVGRYLESARQDAERRARWENNMETSVDSIDRRLSQLEGRTQERDRGPRWTRPGEHR